MEFHRQDLESDGGSAGNLSFIPQAFFHAVRLSGLGTDAKAK